MAYTYIMVSVTILALLISIILLLSRSKSRKNAIPISFPIIGHAHHLSSAYPWLQLQAWHKTHGPILRLRLWQTTAFILGDHSTAKALLTKRSNNYSSRPRLIVAGESVGKSLDTALLPYGPRWKAFHGVHVSLLNARRSRLYRPVQEGESVRLLQNLLESNDFDHELYRYAASLIFVLLYGVGFETGREEALGEIGTLAHDVFESTATGKWLVEKLPILDHLPRVLAPWKLVGDELHARQKAIYDRHFAAAQETSSWNWAKQVVSHPPSGVAETELPFVLGEIFGAGSRTTAGCLAVAVQACVAYPLVARHLQTDLDVHIGTTHLPVFENLAKVKYLHAFVNEVLRWRPLTPSGVAHAPLEDDDFSGFKIPAGSIVIANHWSLDHDSRVFHDPEQFRPERWLEDSSLPLAAWGFGKRMCPGQHLATNSLLLVIARLLWAFDIKWDSNQGTLSEDIGMTHEGLFSRPEAFKAVFEVRSEEHRRAILQTVGNYNVSDALEHIGREFSAL
jgi:cytochrome P450